VSTPRTQPPWEFLLSASRNSLQSFELSRLTHAANLRKEIAALLDQWIDESSEAMLARWLMEQPERPPREAESPASGKLAPEDERSVSHNFFADRGAAHTANRRPA
jgi:hypothetical protein